MRAVILAIALAVIAGAAGWFMHTTPVLNRDSDVSTALTITAPNQSQQGGPHHSAAAAIRSVQIGTTPPVKGTANPSRTIAANASSSSQSKRAESTARESIAPAPKPAADLLAPFLEDDPKQVFLPDTVRNHAAVQAESIDPDWGPAASQAMRDFVQSQLGDQAELVSADCRTDLCELQVVSAVDADSKTPNKFLSLMHQQDWWATLQFDQDSGMITYAPDGRVVMIWYYSRM